MPLPRHPAIIRVTHWTTTASFVGLFVSGIAILLSHPRLYWGETGNVAMPSLVDLPLPFVLKNQNGWGRYLHFLSAWIVLLSGVVYVFFGLATGHFRKQLFRESSIYNFLQRVAYSLIVFAVFPLVIWTGLAMSPALVSVVPGLVTIFGGHQSARTLHFFIAAIVVLFVFGHIVMVSLAGFRERVRAMITGYGVTRKEHA